MKIDPTQFSFICCIDGLGLGSHIRQFSEGISRLMFGGHSWQCSEEHEVLLGSHWDISVVPDLTVVETGKSKINMVGFFWAGKQFFSLALTGRGELALPPHLLIKILNLSGFTTTTIFISLTDIKLDSKGSTSKDHPSIIEYQSTQLHSQPPDVGFQKVTSSPTDLFNSEVL